MSDPGRDFQIGASAALDYVRSIVDTCRAESRRVAQSAVAKPIRSVGVVGAGIMGSAIAIEHAKRSYSVVVVDSNPEALRRAESIASAELAAAERNGRRNARIKSIAFSVEQAALGGCDLVLETIAESRPAKQSLYAAIQPHVAAHAILATNTSAIPIARLSGGLADPSRFCGLHFCHPVSQRPLVEVIAGPATSLETASSVVAHAVALHKLPLVVADGPGFVVNRLLLTYLNAALEMVICGVNFERIDEAMVEFGMPLGPLAALDEIGLDTALQTGMVLAEVFAERSHGSELLLRMVKSGFLGMKSGLGFYIHPGWKKNPHVREIASLVRNQVGTEEIDHCEISHRLLRPMGAEVDRLIDDKKVAFPWQIDLATVFGLGFPFHRGGLRFWAETQH
jgi:3-hydroxyacyl-CoA dehydrogenase